MTDKLDTFAALYYSRAAGTAVRATARVLVSRDGLTPRAHAAAVALQVDARRARRDALRTLVELQRARAWGFTGLDAVGGGQ